MLLDKAKFPRDKFCGDAVIPRAQRHLKRMGVLDQMIDAGECLFTTSGGFVSPAGIECLSDSTDNPNGTPMSAKRIIMDERIVRAAQSAGAELVEEAAIDKVAFDEPAGDLDRSFGQQEVQRAGRSSWRTGPIRSWLDHWASSKTTPGAICSPLVHRWWEHTPSRRTAFATWSATCCQDTQPSSVIRMMS